MPGFVGLPELLLLGVVALLIFGPKRLPEMGRGLGKGMREFKESVTGSHDESHMIHEFKEPVTSPGEHTHVIHELSHVEETKDAA